MELTKETVKTTSSIIEALKAKAKEDPAYHAVFLKFAMRERSRNQVTIRNLTLSMQKESYNFPTTKYQEVLKFLASMGFGRVVEDRKGNLKGLYDISITLQSIGKAALEQNSSLKQFKRPNRYSKIVTETSPKVEKETPVEPLKGGKVELKITIDGKTLTYPGFEMNPDALGNFLVNFNRLSTKVKK